MDAMTATSLQTTVGVCSALIPSGAFLQLGHKTGDDNGDKNML